MNEAEGDRRPAPAPNQQEISLLARAGAALHGEHWQAPLARDLGILIRSLQRWLSGERPVNAAIWDELLIRLARRAEEVRDITAELKKLKAAAGRPSEP